MFDRWVAEAGPLGLSGALLTVDTTEDVDIVALADGIRALRASDAPPAA
jgi:hypothetical protein